MKSTIYIGTGGYSDTDLIGTLYPHSAKANEFLHYYANHYDCVEINASFHAPIGQKTLLGMLNKADGRLKFSFKLQLPSSIQFSSVQSLSHVRLFATS